MVAHALSTPVQAAPLEDSATMLALIREWRDAGWLRPLDCAFAEFLSQQQPDALPSVLLAASLASSHSGRGHLLIDLERILQAPGTSISTAEIDPAECSTPAMAPEEVLEFLSLPRWLSELQASCLVGSPGSERTAQRPLVLDGHRLYLLRYWRYERDITAAIEARLARYRDINEGKMRELLSHLFPETRSTSAPDWQMLACAVAARSHFGVITGGPGTGKTTTVVKLLALLQCLAVTGVEARPLRIRLAAPTGKAAARLNESIAGQVSNLPLDTLPGSEKARGTVPTEVTTLHRLLGARPHTRKFQHHRFNPLPVDLVVVDEASMVDVEMMASLLEALPAHAGLVLIGDKDQLASVEAGAVLGSICAQAQAGHYTSETQDWLHRITGEALGDDLISEPARPLDQSVAMLRHSYRFGDDSGIGRLARAINQNQPDSVREVLDDGALQDLHNVVLQRPEDSELEALATLGMAGRGHGYARYLEELHQERPAPDANRDTFDTWARGVLEAHSQFQLLCALRRGPLGVEGLNPRIEASLVNSGYLPTEAATGSQWYEGRPVLVTGNDYGLKLMNGDIGIVLKLPVATDAEGEPIMALRVAFLSGDGTGRVRWVLPSRLRRVETVFAMTVHKSQGSEFEHAALVLPDSPTPIATRELFYTAVTRAKGLFSLVEKDKNITTHIVRSNIQRSSQLFLT